MVRLLALLIFISSSVAALSLGMMAYTMATGDLPLGITPILNDKPKVNKKAPKEDSRHAMDTMRINEKALMSLYEDIMKEKENLAEEKKKLATKEKIVQEIRDEALKMQQEIAKTESKLNNTLQRIDKVEIDNIRKITALMSGMEIAQTTKMLMEMEDNKVSRILYYMNQKMASKIIDQVLQTGNDEQVKRMKKITDKMQTLSEDGKNE